MLKTALAHAHVAMITSTAHACSNRCLPRPQPPWHAPTSSRVCGVGGLRMEQDDHEEKGMLKAAGSSSLLRRRDSFVQPQRCRYWNVLQQRKFLDLVEGFDRKLWSYGYTSGVQYSKDLDTNSPELQGILDGPERNDISHEPRRS
ncbi:hypothetical protein FB45DRAFT_861299 [Roridomyces roridus]|uniref:Uncharacterized protein n=1 Tax=Roridomyces roridus TaxID=1738132 RepID=A0AAD7CA91_9AGAR|nr:hypothetical protein FB45DRAFT_861299 [Roridomyces roridus]